MIHESLNTLPKFIQMQIYETGDISLLTDKKIFDYDKLLGIWQKLEQEFNDKYNKFESNKVFNLSKEIGFLVGKYQSIKYSCDALLFDKNQELIALLSDFGYTITSDNYLEDINKALRESEGIINKINNFKNLLPKQKEASENKENSIIEVMSGYSAIVGYDFDYYTISVVKFHAIEKTVQQKMKVLESQISKSKKS